MEAVRVLLETEAWISTVRPEPGDIIVVRLDIFNMAAHSFDRLKAAFPNNPLVVMPLSSSLTATKRELLMRKLEAGEL